MPKRLKCEAAPSAAVEKHPNEGDIARLGVNSSPRFPNLISGINAAQNVDGATQTDKNPIERRLRTFKRL